MDNSSLGSNGGWWCDRATQAGERRLRARLATAQAAIGALNAHRRGKRRYREVTPLRQAVDAVLSQYQVEGLLTVTVAETVRERPVRLWAAAGDRAGPTHLQRDCRRG